MKTPFGEVDIVARNTTTVLFVEVKARFNRNDFYDVIGKRQIGRLMRAMEWFSIDYGCNSIQLDLITLDLQTLQIDRIENITVYL